MWKRSKFKTVLIGILIVFILLMSADLFLMLFGGQYLAEMSVPSLPIDTTYIDTHYCSGASSMRAICKEYLTSYTPEMVVSGWDPANLSLEQFSSGSRYYEYSVCNENILGRQYRLFHSDQPYDGRPCTNILVYLDKTGKTRISVRLIWTKCLMITKEARVRGYIDYYSRLNSWCSDG